MGCDCHAHFEVKIGNKWEHYSVPNIGRYYKVFEKMAGVRGDVNNAIAPPKGLPDDISIITKIDANYWKGDAHTHSWLSSKEFNKLYKFHKLLIVDSWEIDKQYGYLFSNDFGSFKPGAEGYPKKIQDFRLVFWFDN